MLSCLLMLLRTEEEREQFTRFYQKYENLMFKAARLVLDKQEDCEDAVQSSCAYLIDHFDKITSYDPAQAASYAVLLVRSRSMDILRKQNQASCEDIKQYSNAIPTEAEQSGSMPLESAFERLPERYKEMLTLYYYNGLKIREIAEMQQLSVSAVKKLLQRSRDTLRDLMIEEGYKDK